MRFQIDHDYHLHSRLSRCSGDDSQTPERILRYAKDNGLKEICITDHFWDKNVGGASNWYSSQDYEHIAQSLPLPQSEDVKFYFGCETDLNKNLTLGVSDKLLDRFDFIIIPTTHLHMLGFTIEKEDTSAERRAELYVNRLDKLLDMDLPFHKIGIAHLTCSLIAYDRNDWEEHLRILDLISSDTYRELFEKIVKKGAGFELNFKINRYSEEQLERVLRPYRIAKEVGCKFYLGSDGHRPSELEAAIEKFNGMIDALDLKDTDRFFFGK